MKADIRNPVLISKKNYRQVSLGLKMILILPHIVMGIRRAFEILHATQPVSKSQPTATGCTM